MTMEEIDIVTQMTRKYPTTFQLANSVDHIENSFHSGMNDKDDNNNNYLVSDLL
jgi:hypothetical protein